MTLNDLLDLYRSFKKQDVDMPTFAKKWAGIVGKGTAPELEWDNKESEHTIAGIPLDDRQAFDMAVSPFIHAYKYYDPKCDYDCSLGMDVEYDDWIEMLELYLADKDKKILDRRFPEFLKHDFISRYREDGPSKDEDVDLVRTLFRKFVDEYVTGDLSFGYEVKGYACYGGSWAYECDWKMSRDMITKLLEKDQDPFAANTLGYIYYYGRCNNGKPQYEEAMKYFMIGTAHGLYESAYKLGDLYYNGYGIPKMSDGARHLYAWVYAHSREDFLKGSFGTQFADAALRLGRYKWDLINPETAGPDCGQEEDAENAYAYLLQADYAIRLRIQDHDHYGDNVVYSTIQDLKAKAGDHYRMTGTRAAKKSVKHFFPFEFANILSDHKRAELEVKEISSGKYRLTVRLSPYDVLWSHIRILLTVPEKDFCRFVSGVTYNTSARSVVKLRSKKQISIPFSKIFYENDECVFYDGSRWVAKVESAYYSLQVPREKKKTGSKEKLRFVSIRFSPEGRLYDYLCDDVSVAAGSKVIVNGYEGETQVTVEKVFERDEDSPGLPVERYKTILRKA